jgi:hypothetical protein
MAQPLFLPYKTRKGKERTHTNFSTATIRDRAEDIGEPWKTDYQSLYHLFSMHAHGAPGAVIQQHFVKHANSPESRERNSTALIACLSMKAIVNVVHLLVEQGLVDGAEKIDEVFDTALNEIPLESNEP